MSDSDDDLLQNNIFTYANDNTTICAKGPNVNNTNMTGLSFRNNVLTSTMRMPVNFERQRYAGSHYDQRSMYCRREMSPMSLRGASDFGSRNFNHSTYKNSMGCRSMYNGRGGSPFSVRSIDSTATVSAVDIAFAFKNTKFDSHDLRIIKEAYKQLIKPHRRKRIEKRRNLRLLLKRSHRKSGEDSGEQGSDSSISSDDGPVKTTICTENLRQPQLNTNIRDNQIVKDCTENIKQNILKNMITNNRSNYTTKEMIQNTSVIRENRNPFSTTLQNMSVMTQKERFRRGFLLPSQRFDKTVNATIHENDKNKLINGTRKNNVNSCSKMAGPDSDSDSDEIFRGFTEDTNQTCMNRKRALDTDDACSNRKRSRLDSPKQRLPNSAQTQHTNIHNGQSNDFIFAKPKMPVKKSDTRKVFAEEKLLAKSRVPSIAEENDLQLAQTTNNLPTNNLSEKNNNEDIENETHTDIQNGNNDVSMRPSFIKRKLFTQKLDVAENKNVSCDSAATNSPQNIYTEALRERNKARKLVTSQSCLSRDIAGDDSNVLDLIHKIVPPDQINTTKIANKTDLSNNKSKNVHNDEKWDVTSAILNCNNQDVSDTYTDEEIFNITFNKESTNKDKCKKAAEKPKPVPQCKIFVEKLNPKTVDTILKNNNNYELPQLPRLQQTDKEAGKKRVTDCVKSFWDTDFESDMEFNVASTLKTNAHSIQGLIPQNKINHCPGPKLNNTKKGTIIKGTILNVRNCYKEAKLNISFKSQKDQTVKDKVLEKNEKLNSLAKANTEVTVGEKKKLNNKKHNTNETKDTEKENVPVINKQDSGRKPKVKKCIDCNDQNQSDTTKKANTSNKLKKKNEKVKQPAQKSNNKSVCSPEPKQTKKDSTSKTQCAKNSTVKLQNTNMNVRIQPKRKSKEKSFTQSPKPRKMSNNTKATLISNNSTKSKLKKDSVSKNSSLNSLNTRTTRSSREKLAFDSSGYDQSSVNVSNISNRSLRFLQRNFREYKMH